MTTPQNPSPLLGQSVAALLAGTGLFGSLGDADRQAVASQMRKVEFNAGQMIFSRGDPGREIYLVLDGRVRLSILTVEGRELSFIHASRGNIFGEIAALDGGMRTADATAITRVTTMTLPQSALKRLIETSPAVASAAITFLCSRLRDTDQQLEAIALHPIEVRLARFLLSAIILQKPVAKGDRVTVDLAMSQSELALLIGASRPKVNAALAVLEDTGVIKRLDGRIECDRAALQDFAEMG